MSVIAFDSFGLTQYLGPQIESVIYPVKEMAEYGVSEVLSRLQNQRLHHPAKSVFPLFRSR